VGNDIDIWAIILILVFFAVSQYLTQRSYIAALRAAIEKAMSNMSSGVEAMDTPSRPTVVMTLRDQQYPNLFRLVNLLPEIRLSEQFDAIMPLFPLLVMTGEMSEEQLRQILPPSVECVISTHRDLGEANDDRYVALRSEHGKLIFRNSGGILTLHLDVVVCEETAEQLDALFNNLGLPVGLVEVGKPETR